MSEIFIGAELTAQGRANTRLANATQLLETLRDQGGKFYFPYLNEVFSFNLNGTGIDITTKEGLDKAAEILAAHAEAHFKKVQAN